MTAPDVRVGIVSYETAPELRRCLAALPAALDGLVAEVVVVDNASRDDSRQVARSAPGVRLVAQATNTGYARAMNVALSGSSAPVLVALNPDTVPAPGSLRRLVTVLEQDPGVGLAVPVLRNADDSLQHSVHRFPSVTSALLTGLLPHRLRGGALGGRLWMEGFAPHDRATDVDWAIGAVHVLRASALSRPTPYSERWFMYVEDMEICWDLHARGWRVRLEPTSVVRHIGNVAGARTFGAKREERWLDALYDWYVTARGSTAARGFAIANVLGLLVKSAVLRWHGDEQRRARCRALLQVHGRRVLRPGTTGLSLRPPAT